jgi:hypothetical protein
MGGVIGSGFGGGPGVGKGAAAGTGAAGSPRATGSSVLDSRDSVATPGSAPDGPGGRGTALCRSKAVATDSVGGGCRLSLS